MAKSAAAKATAKAAAAPSAPAMEAGAASQAPEVLPANKKPCVGDGVLAVPELPKKPILPAADRRDIGSRETMKVLVPWLLQELKPALLKLEVKVQDLAAAKPLALPVSADGGGLTSFKEPWVPKNCLMSVKRSGVYEAGGNLLWVDPETTEDTLMPFEDVPWASLHNLATTQFAPTTFEKSDRIRFPIPLQCWLRSGVKSLSETQYPKGGLAPLGGHPFMWAWYLAMFFALEESDGARVKLLYECSLTTTICMFTTDSKANLALESIRMSETLRSNAQVATDNFIIFTRKVALMQPAATGGKFDLKLLCDKDVRFQGGLINKTMITTMQSLFGIMSSGVVMSKFDQLDREFGRDVLTGSYNKLKLFLSFIKSDADACAWVLETMIVALQRKEVDPSVFTIAAYQKSKSGEPNFISTALAIREIVLHILHLSEGIGAVDQKLAERISTDVTSKLQSPAMFNAAFPISGEEGPECEGNDESSGVQASGFMGNLTSAPQAAILTAELLKNAYEGGYKQAVVALANSSSPADMLHNMSEAELGSLAKDVSEIMKCVHASDLVVGLSSGKQAPKATFRELVRRPSGGGDAEAAAAEREDVWRRAVAQRKKIVTLAVVKNPKSRAGFLETLNKFPAFSAFQGKFNESHRVLVLSAELLNQKGKMPWLEASPPEETIFQEMCQFLTTHGRGPCDTIVAFDGGMRKCRRVLEDSVGKLPGSAEIFVVYTTSWNGWIKKKYFLNSEHTECGYVALSTARTRHIVKARADGLHASGDKTSHWTSLTGVVPAFRSSLPRITPEDKAKIFLEATDTLPTRWSKHVPTGVPMFWGEVKSVSTWASLMEEFNAKSIVDLSPGSGALASAALKLGIPYLGLLGNNAHLTWLTNVIDRSSLKYMCETSNVLYQEDLATHLKELFADVIDNAADSVNDDLIGADSDNEG